MAKEPGTEQEKLEPMLHELYGQVQELSNNMEKMRLAEYIEMFEKPRRLLYINFLIGVARGFGSAIGFTILAAVIIYILQKIVVLNMPLIGSIIAEIVKIVQKEMNIGGVIFLTSGKI